MLNYSRIIPLLLIALLACSGNVEAGDMADIKDTVKKSFKVKPGGTLFLDISHGNVDIAEHSGSEVLVEVERTVSTDSRETAKEILNRHDLRIEQRSSNVYIESRHDREDGFFGRVNSRNKLRVRVLVQVPREYNVDFTTGAGNVSVGDLTGRVEGRTGAGNIVIGAVRGPIEISSGSGNIDVEGAVGTVEANTGAGNVRVKNVKGEANINTGAGNIEAYITEQPREDSHLTTGAGNVTVHVGARIGLDVDAQTGIGSAATDFPLKIEGKFMSKSFSGDVNGGGPALVMHSGVGNVVLRKI